ncbi:hypothetical protein JADG_002970 [Aureobasidium aubasidani]|nr:hypothetical protein JADG_002970 [Aureobasidium pullulans]
MGATAAKAQHSNNNTSQPPLSAWRTAAARCYNLQGTAPPDGSFVACNPDAEVSACCASNKAQPDICMQGGLCYATMDSYSGYLYGNGCTDPTASDDACPIVCPAKANGWKAFNVLPSESDSSNTTTVVGAAVGAVLGVACIIALVGMLWMMRKVKNLKKEMQSLKQDTYAPSSNAVMSPQQPYHVPQNAGPTTHAYEADWNNGRYEIDGTGK